MGPVQVSDDPTDCFLCDAEFSDEFLKVAFGRRNIATANLHYLLRGQLGRVDPLALAVPFLGHLVSDVVQFRSDEQVGQPDA